jgi:hypothetical protein
MAGCATLETAGHKYVMRGQILEVTDGLAYLCVGSKDGAAVGQQLTVYRFVRTTPPFPKNVQPYFKREEAGKIRITEIIDEHMATAKILSGDVKVNDVVELEQ